ncbi:hypothetical protein [Intrasporangium sp. DVR]|uniref:hypothetical protein n=1 Tax=Intrasporangium sp. DVR TaxID=3127867 RepID=UPI0033415487
MDHEQVVVDQRSDQRSAAIDEDVLAFVLAGSLDGLADVALDHGGVVPFRRLQGGRRVSMAMEKSPLVAR